MNPRPPGEPGCTEYREMYELYALGVLEAGEKRDFDEHLETGCETCARGIKRALASNAMLVSFAPDVAPPKSLRKRVVAAAGGETKSAWGWAAALVAAAFLAATFWFSLEARRLEGELTTARNQLRASQADLVRVQAALRFLDQPETRLVGFGGAQPAPPRGNVFVNPRAGVLLIASNLPPAPSGRIYEMWVLPKTGAPRPAGLFQSDAGGTAVHILPGAIDLGATSAVAVTLEPESGSPGPTTTPIIVAAVSGL